MVREAIYSQNVLRTVAILVIATFLPIAAPLTSIAAPADRGAANVEPRKVGGYFDRHPKIRKAAKAAGIGALTGGLGATILGGSILGRAATSASLRAGVTTAKDSKFFKKKFRRR
jgi:hypothetical protein